MITTNHQPSTINHQLQTTNYKLNPAQVAKLVDALP